MQLKPWVCPGVFFGWETGKGDKFGNVNFKKNPINKKRK